MSCTQGTVIYHSHITRLSGYRTNTNTSGERQGHKGTTRCAARGHRRRQGHASQPHTPSTVHRGDHARSETLQAAAVKPPPTAQRGPETPATPARYCRNEDADSPSTNSTTTTSPAAATTSGRWHGCTGALITVRQEPTIANCKQRYALSPYTTNNRCKGDDCHANYGPNKGTAPEQ